MIKWEVFFDNSSTTDALTDFAGGDLSFDKFLKDCWPPECKNEIRKMIRIGYRKCIRNSRAALFRRGYSCD